ncbi:MBL fold metallo-hydrolase [Sphingomonas sp. ID0503]|uniref:MBL fold metallo-hydrolase n=1 Tax=Sphingomonas sp. ID0503 TaxID=3399691 RepID=UPI003AFB74F1
MKVTILGCGTSSGVPRIGGNDGQGEWGSCDPAEPRNRRRRASILVRTKAASVLIDTAPDMREQLLAARVGHLDAVIWTHDHADHCNGIDDLRQVYQLRGSEVPGYARAATIAGLKQRFGYVFEGRGGYPATVAIAELPDRLVIGDLAIHVIDQPHGRITAAGLVFEQNDKRIGYATDFNEMTAEMRTLYEGLDIWIVDALRREPHPTHPTLADALRWRAELNVKRTVLVHMDWSMDYATLLAELPGGVEPGYDGLVLEA